MQNGSHEPYPAHFGLFVIHTLGLVTINVCAKFEVPIFTHYGNTKGNAKCIKKIRKIAHGKACNRENFQGHSRPSLLDRSYVTY